jgi:2OG-Fe(II) oxygenase superfamily
MLGKGGVHVIENFLAPSQCEELLTDVERYRTDREPPLIVRREPDRSLYYRVIDGEQVYRFLPRVVRFYSETTQVVRQVSGLDLAPLENRAVSVNINITPVGGEYRWHYDRNAVTAILYLNQVSGGETEMYPGCRVYLGKYKDTIAQRWLDKISRQPVILRRFGKRMCVAPRAGMLIVMRGDQCLHSVRRVESGERINVIMAFDRRGASFKVEKHLDAYLYSQSEAPHFDPNYR